jgi:hypothetical protein
MLGLPFCKPLIVTSFVDDLLQKTKSSQHSLLSQKNLIPTFRLNVGSSFLKSSEEKDDSEATSRRSQSDVLSPKKSILKASPTTKPVANPTTTTSNARANLMAKDDKKIHFDLNENLELHSEVWLTNNLGRQEGGKGALAPLADQCSFKII